MAAAERWILETVNSALKTKGKPTVPSEGGEIICRKGMKEADNWETAVTLLEYDTVNVKKMYMLLMAMMCWT